MAGDDVVVHFTRRELQVFALWADAAREDRVVETLIGDSRGVAAYRRAFDKLDRAAWGGSTPLPAAEPEPELQNIRESAVEYRVRRLEGREAAEIERACNEHAADGWRLVSASTAATGAKEGHTYLFFSRKVADDADAIARAAIRFSTIQTH